MRSIIIKISFALIMLISFENGFAQSGVSVNITGNNPDNSAMLDVSASDKGLLIPRISLTGSTSALPVTAPLTSLLVYNQASAGDVIPGYYFWNNSNKWERIVSGTGCVSCIPFWKTNKNALSYDTTWFHYNGTDHRLSIGKNAQTPEATILTVRSASSASQGIYSEQTSGATAVLYGIQGRVEFGGSGTSYTTAQGYLGYHTGTSPPRTYSVYGKGGDWGGFFDAKVLIGNNTPSPTINTGDLEVQNTVSGSAYPANLTLRQTTSIATTGDTLAYLNFGDNHRTLPQARITAFRGAYASGSSDLPTDIVFSNIADGSSVLTERMRIANSGNVGIGVVAPNASALLDVSASDKGLLIPRIALTATTSASPVTSPAASLLVYNTATTGDVTPGYYYWDATNKWLRLSTGSGSSSGWGLSGNAGTDSVTNFLGTTDAQALVMKTSNSERMRINKAGSVGIGTTAPSSLLEVNGTTSSQKFLAKTSGDRLDPAFRFGFDTYNPGIYRAGSDILGFTAAGQASFGIGPSWASVGGTSQVAGAMFSMSGGSPFIVMVPNGAPGTSKMILLKNQASTNRWSLRYVDEGPPNTGTTRLDFAYEPTNKEYVTIRDNGNVGIGTTTPATNARLAIKDGHIQSQQTTAPTVSTTFSPTVLTLTNATDVAGKIAVDKTTGAGTVTVTFNKAYSVAPVVVITPINYDAAVDMARTWITTSTNNFVINYNGGQDPNTLKEYNYMVIETQ